MAAADMAVWRRQNSDVIHVELQMADGSVRRGTVLLSRDKTLREFLNIGAEAFIDFECKRDGAVVLAKSSVRAVRQEDPKKQSDQAKVDALAARQTELDKTDHYKVLGVPTNIDPDGLRKAYITKARTYHPDRFAESELPAEIFEYLNAMTRRLNAAYEELSNTVEAAAKSK